MGIRVFGVFGALVALLVGAAALQSSPAIASAPANDAFAAAVELSPPQMIEGDTSEATPEEGEPGWTCFEEGARTVWYRVEPATAGLLSFLLESEANLGIAVYRGTSFTDLEEVTCRDWQRANEEETYAFSATAGDSYAIAIAGDTPSDAGSFVLEVALAEPVTDVDNDDFRHAQIATPGEPIVGDTTNASLERNETSPSCEASEAADAPPPSVWFRMRAPADGVLKMVAWASDADLTITQYRGHHVGRLEEVACVNAWGFGTTEGFDMRANTTYYVRVGGYRSSSKSPFVVHTRFVDRPPEDDFDTPATIEPGYTTAKTWGAAHQPDEPRGSCAWSDGPTVWYRFVSPAAGAVEVDLRSETIDSFVLSIYKGTSIDALTEHACIKTIVLPERTRVAVGAGEALLFAIAGAFDDEWGTFDINVDVIDRPANDDFAAASPLDVVASVAGSTEGSTVESGEPRPCSTDGGTVWYSYTAPTNGTLVVDVDNSFFDVTIFKGSDLASLTEVACSGGFADPATATVVAGQTYAVMVSDSEFRAGSFTLTSAFTPGV